MTSYRVEPYVAGRLGAGTKLDDSTHPPSVERLDYEFEEWPGTDIVGSYPCVLVSHRLARGMLDAELSGVVLDDVTVTVDPQMRRFFPDEAAALPRWHWLRPPSDRPGSDLRRDGEGRLVVSQRAMDVLDGFDLTGAHIVPVEQSGDISER